jgi:GT2 family glycosyltransferase
MKAHVSIVLGSYNRYPFLKAAIRSIRENRISVPYEILVVDGGSTDASLPWLSQQKDIITIVQHNHGSFMGKALERRSWGYFMNLGFKAAQGKYICMISDDSLLLPNAVMNGIAVLEQAQQSGQKVGAGAFYWRNSWPTDKEYMVSRTIGNIPFVNHGLYVRSALETVNWLDEAYYQFYCADIDICLRMQQAGYEILDIPNAYVEHYFQASVSGREQISSVKITDEQNFVKRWSVVFPELTEEKIVLAPLVNEYNDPDRTGYRLYPQISIFKIKLQSMAARIIHRLHKIDKKDK